MSTFPCVLCGGKCCSSVSMSKSEFKKITRRYGLPEGAKVEKMKQMISFNPDIKTGDTIYVPMMPDKKCPWLVNNKCSVYMDRPRVCRDYGNIPEMPCQYLYPDLAKKICEETLRKSREMNG